ncbi:hypothetical protein HMPREF3189_01515 [Clostridiales bacterium KA00134]|nr:hypothetical protein HMPREF3189_01515 [Clostridiales bacterium KA00134]
MNNRIGNKIKNIYFVRVKYVLALDSKYFITRLQLFSACN